MFINKLSPHSLEVVLVDLHPLDLPGRLDEDPLELGLCRLLVDDDVEHIGVPLPHNLVRIRIEIRAENGPEKFSTIR